MNLEPDIGEAQQFVAALTGNPETPCSWQTYDDSKSKRSPGLVRVLHGSLSQVAPELKRLNEQGAGIFITINETDLRGRKAENIRAIRALFVDSDNGPIKNGKVPMGIHVKTARGEHGYWPLRPGESLARFAEAQSFLSKALGTDPSVSDLPRVMRVPGFWHLKDEPFLVKTIKVDTRRRYTIDDILGPYRTHNDERASRYARQALIKEVGLIAMSVEGGRHKQIERACRALGGLVGGGMLDRGVMIHEITRAAKIASGNGSHPIEEKELDDMINDGLQYGQAHPRKKKEKQKESKSEEEKNLSPNEMAIAMMDEHSILRDGYDNTYRYNGRYWEGISINQLKSVALKYDREEATSERRRIETVNRVLSDWRTQRGRVMWNTIGESEVPLQAGIFDIITGELKEHSPKRYLDKVIDIDYHNEATCPLWEKCLVDWFGPDTNGTAKVRALQEFFGYILLAHNKYKKALMLYGQGDTGKSVIANIMRELVGSNNCCQIQVDKLNDPRALAPIKGKMINLITELPEDVMVADGGFKQLVGTDELIQIDQKYHQPELYLPTCKHVFATNNLPDINDKTAATFNRILLIQLENPIDFNNQDRSLHNKLCDELPGILNWAINGARRLIYNCGAFTVIPGSSDFINSYRSEQNPIKLFIDESLTSEEGIYNMKFSTFCQRFNNSQWAGRNWSARAIGKALTALGYNRASVNSVRIIVGWIPKKNSATVLE